MGDDGEVGAVRDTPSLVGQVLAPASAHDFVIVFQTPKQRKYYVDICSAGDAQLFCDSTHCVSKYSALQLLNFVLRSSSARGIPVGHALLSAVDAVNVKRAMETLIFSGGGRRPKYLMTDEDDTLLKGVSAAIPGIIHYLCQWHLM